MMLMYNNYIIEHAVHGQRMCLRPNMVHVLKKKLHKHPTSLYYDPEELVSLTFNNGKQNLPLIFSSPYGLQRTQLMCDQSGVVCRGLMGIFSLASELFKPFYYAAQKQTRPHSVYLRNIFSVKAKKS